MRTREGDGTGWSKSIPNCARIVAVHNNLCVYCVVDTHWLPMPWWTMTLWEWMGHTDHHSLCMYSGEQHQCRGHTVNRRGCAWSKLVSIHLGYLGFIITDMEVSVWCRNMCNLGLFWGIQICVICAFVMNFQNKSHWNSSSNVQEAVCEGMLYHTALHDIFCHTKRAEFTQIFFPRCPVHKRWETRRYIR